MINFKTQEDVLPSSLILLSIVLLAGTLMYMLLVPEPTTSDVVRARHSMTRKITTDILYDRKRADIAQAAIEPRVWVGSQNHVGSAVLELITTNALQQSLQLTAFRPQRTSDLDGIIELPYTVQLAGSFTGIRQLMRILDGARSKVVLRSVQVNASEEVTDTVTATLVVSAYIGSPQGVSQTIEKADGNGQN